MHTLLSDFRDQEKTCCFLLFDFIIRESPALFFPRQKRKYHAGGCISAKLPRSGFSSDDGERSAHDEHEIEIAGFYAVRFRHV